MTRRPPDVSSDAVPASLGPVPAPWRDPWAWVSAASVLPVLFKCAGAPLGEPAAEDFDFLRHVWLGGHHSWLDGGGSLSFWRPLAQQVYYGALGGVMVGHPQWIAALHALFVAATAMLLYRVLRAYWPGPLAAAAAAFPFLAEPARSLVSWPSQFADLGCLFFSVLALHEAARRRLTTGLGALAAALLCKEQAVVAALLMPWLPTPPAAGIADGPAVRARARWFAATAVVVVAWGLADLWVRRTTGMHLPHGLGGNPEIAAVPLATRIRWALLQSSGSIFGLPPVVNLPGEIFAGLVFAGILAAFAVLAIRATQRRDPASIRLGAWGLLWFLLASAALTFIFPLWAPVRSIYSGVGLAILLVAAFRAIRPELVALFLGVRLVALLASPPPPATIEPAPVENGAFMDFGRMARLQLLMAKTREALARRHPALPHHGVIALSNMPRGALYAFGDARAFQVWYRDTSLGVTSIESFAADTTQPVAAIAQFQLDHSPQVATIDPRAARLLVGARGPLTRGQYDAALATLDEADRAQGDRDAVQFLADIVSWRALALSGRGDVPGAEAEARRAVALAPRGRTARLTLTSILFQYSGRKGAREQLDTLAHDYPGDTLVMRLRRLLGAPR